MKLGMAGDAPDLGDDENQESSIKRLVPLHCQLGFLPRLLLPYFFPLLGIRGKMLLPVDRHWGVSLYVPRSECPNEDLKKF